MIAKQRRTDGAAGVPGGRLNPDVLKDLFTENLPIGNTVQSHAAGKCEVRRPSDVPDVSRQLEHHIFEHHLDGCGQIHFASRYSCFRLTWRATEQIIECLVRHRAAIEKTEILGVETERAVLLDID